MINRDDLRYEATQTTVQRTLTREQRERFRGIDYHHGHLTYLLVTDQAAIDAAEKLCEAGEAPHDAYFDEVYWDNHTTYYADTHEPMDRDNPRPCAACRMPVVVGEPDPCIGTLPGVLGACCGHGGVESSYVCFENGFFLHGFNRITYRKQSDS
ncbi:hypothetical protein ACRBEV_25685 [Methylobacterium phyllosphaerae]